MKQSSIDQLKNDFFEIQNFSSKFNQYYHLSPPYNAVIETFCPDFDSPYFKISSFSPERCHHSTISDEAILAKMKNRPLHQHDFFEIMFVLQGEAVVNIENSQRIYPAGTGCIVNCNLRHVELLTHDFRIFFLNLSKDYLLKLFKEDDMFHLPTKFDAAAANVFRFLFENASDSNNTKKQYMDFFPTYSNSESFRKLYKLAEKIVQISLNPQTGSSYFLNGTILQFMDVLSDPDFFHLSNVHIDSGNDFLIFTKLTHLLENSDGRLSRHELAEQLSYSGDYLNRITKKYTGMTLFEYGTTFSIRKAEYYLLKTDLTITEILSELSFTNKSHFYKLFYAKNQMSPKDFRNKYRNLG